jgi:hypothetical protein
LDEQILTIIDALTKDVQLAHEEIANLRAEMAEHDKKNNEQIQNLNHTVFDLILEPCQQAMDEAEYNGRFDEFKGKYGEQFAPYVDDIKFIEQSPDFDLEKAAFDGLENWEGEKPDEAQYVAEFVEHIKNQVEEFKKRFGALPDVDVKIDTEGGEVKEVKAEGNAPEAAETTETVEEDSEEVMDSPEEIAELEKQLAAEMRK